MGRQFVKRLVAVTLTTTLLSGVTAAPAAARSNGPDRPLAVPVAPASVVEATDPAPALSAAVIGGQLFTTGGSVQVKVLPASAGHTSALWLYEPGPAIRIATST